MSKMNLVDLPVDEIRFLPYNPNKMPDEKLQGLEASHKEWGVLQNVVVNDRRGKDWKADERGKYVVAGEHRLKVAKRQKLTTYPVLVVSVGPVEEERMNLALNNAGSYDPVLLGQLLREIQKAKADLTVTGFVQGEIDLAIQELEKGITQEAEEDEIPPLPLKAITKPGELIILGRHRLLCGDAGDLDSVKRLIGDQGIHLVNTDPPYNVNVEPRSNNAISTGLRSKKSHPGNMRADKGGHRLSSRDFYAKENARRDRKRAALHHQQLDLARHPGKSHGTTKTMRARDGALINDFISDEEFRQKLTTWLRNLATPLLPGRCFYLWGGYHNCFSYSGPLTAVPKPFFSQTIIWHKLHPVLTRLDFMGDHEWCFYGWKLGAAHFKNKAIRNCPDVWPVKKVNPSSMIHLTEKPVELSRRAMLLSSRPGENVLDLFAGGGGTLIAAEETDRTAFLMELDPRYCDVIRERFENFSQASGSRPGAA